MFIFLGEREPYNKYDIYDIPEKLEALSGEDYEIGQRINSGGNAVVHECLDSNGNELAIKFLLKHSKKIQKRFDQEIHTLKCINHEHIIKYIDSGQVSVQIQNQSKIIKFIVMERADCNLLEFVKKMDAITYEIYAPQFRGLAQALSVLHKKAIHRDIKPENILVKGEKWLLSDLGLCQLYEEEYMEITGENEKIGPKFWMSPEALNNTINNTDIINSSSDVFQLCSVFWFVINKRHPTGIVTADDWINEDKSVFELIYLSLLHNYKKRPQNGAELYDLIYKATIEK
jgi:serine/threonine protein kinase